MNEHLLERELRQQAGAMRAMARALVGAGDADDLVQEVAVRLLRRPPPRPGPLGGLIATMLHQLAAKLRRGERRRRYRERVVARSDVVPGPEHEVARHEVVARVLRELLALPAPYRETLLQRYFEEYSPARIARRTGVPVETVKTRQKRALTMLRERLDAAAGGRERWLGALVGACGLERAVAGSGAAAAGTGAIVMASAAKVVLVGSLAAAAVAVSWFASGRADAPPPRPAAHGGGVSVAAGASSRGGSAPGAAATERRDAASPRSDPVGEVAPPVATAESFLQRLNTAWPLDRADAIARELAALPGNEVLAILAAIYLRIDNAQVRQMLFAPLVQAHPQLGPALWRHGAGDPAAEVRAAALAELSHYAFMDFTADPERYEGWWAVHGASSARDAMRASLAVHVGLLRTLRGEAFAAAVGRIDRHAHELARRLGLDLADLLEQAGIGELFEQALARDGAAAATAIWDLVGRVGADAGFLRRHAVPLLQLPDELSPDLRSSVYDALARCPEPWAGEVLLGAMQNTAAADDGAFFGVAAALGSRGDPTVIPTMIGMIEADGTYRTVYGVGYFGLTKLTGVPFDRSHDGKWWRRWWQENRHRLPAHVRDLPIPVVRLR